MGTNRTYISAPDGVQSASTLLLKDQVTGTDITDEKKRGQDVVPYFTGPVETKKAEAETVSDKLILAALNSILVELKKISFHLEEITECPQQDGDMADLERG